MKHILFVIYDSIENSVFAGQVVTPLVELLAQHPNNRGLIISFEKHIPSPAALTYLKQYPNIDHLILRQIPFLGSISVRYAAYQLNRAVKNYTIAQIIARGPLASWILANTKTLDTIPCTVQARGLAAEEYAYAHNEMHSWFMERVHQFRGAQYRAIEQYTYGTYAVQPHVMIRAVSKALKEYLIKTFGAPVDKIIVEATDIPSKINATTIQTWRNALRTELSIAPTAPVYVYNGSAKPWQCPEQTIAYFADEYKKNSANFLLILTQDRQPFIDLCKHYAIVQSAYHITHVPHEVIYRYLAAADMGIIFRKSHIINWISRPTKVLEYHAVGLKIIHNNTVAMLTTYNP